MEIMANSKNLRKFRFVPGWYIIAAATLVTFGFYGVSGSFGVFLKPMEESLTLTRTSISSVMSLFMASGGITGIIAGRLTDRYGPRIIFGTGAAIGFSGYLLMNWANSLWQIYLFFGVMAGISMGACFTPVIATVSKWFTDKRVLAVGITTGGMSLGQMLFPIFSTYLIAGEGWRHAYLILALVILLTAAPAVILLGIKPSRSTSIHSNQPAHNIASKDIKSPGISESWSSAKAVRTVPFWMFVVVAFVTATGFYILMVHIVAYAISLGIPPLNAALILTFFNIGSIATQFLIWYVARKSSSRLTLILSLGLQGLALFLFMGVSGFYWLIILGTIFGLGFGGANTTRLSMISEIFGTKSAGAIIGLISAAWAAGGIVGPILAGSIFDFSSQL